MLKSKLLILILFFVLIVSCNEKVPIRTSVKSMNEIQSEYIGTEESMTKFLKCWSEEIKSQNNPSMEQTSGKYEFDPRLSKSAQDFFKARALTGFTSLYEKRFPKLNRFVDPKSLRTFHESSPKDYKIWHEAFGTLSIPDDQYYLYSKEQQTGFRGKDLETMLVLGSEYGGAYYLMLPNQRTLDGEAEILFIHHGGLIARYKSFAHFLSSLYLEEREEVGGSDSSLGHLYHFPGDLKKTCVHYIIAI